MFDSHESKSQKPKQIWAKMANFDKLIVYTDLGFELDVGLNMTT